ncbi:MAG TPA: TIGR01777 family oxidoreductase [Chthoniobacterales bacterium]|nr:TIGR01777 family oxidoreductase [Chthoniobacterales bacterium]
MKSRVVIAGGSGFVGQGLTACLLARDYEVIILTRHPGKRHDGATEIQWDGQNPGDWVTTLGGAEVVINLTGKSVNSRHTPENKREILESRVNSVRALGHAIERASAPPRVFIQATGVGIYQDRGDAWSDENAPHGSDFMAQVCEHWEGAFNGIDAPNTRKIILRLGVVMGRNGGFLALLGRLTRWFLGGHIGNGRQFISWIHIDDLVRMFIRAIEDDTVAGVLNATAPNPVRNSEFMRELRRTLHRPWSPPVPVFAARLGSALMGTEAELALVSQRCSPKRFLEHGFQFDFPELRSALHHIYSKS